MRTPARPTRRLTSAAAALAIGMGLVALSGCGGGDSGSSSDAAVGYGAGSAAGDTSIQAFDLEWFNPVGAFADPGAVVHGALLALASRS